MIKYISFDVYDTLIKRIMTVQELYRAMERVINNENKIECKDFCKKRIAAQKELNNKRIYSYSIEDIYQTDYFKSMKADEINRLIKLEEEFEVKNAVVCEEGKSLYDLYKKQYSIICISDMYLHEGVIRKILENNGYDISKIYVSCDFNESKREKGLYKKVLNELHISKVQLMHIGDAIRSDYINPRLLGIRALHINKHKNQDDGFDILGPIVYEFCQWVHNQAKGRSLFFLMREGEIIQKYYHSIYPNEQSFLVPLSRQAIFKGMVYLLLQKQGVEEIIQICHQIRIFSINELIDVLEVSCDKSVSKQNNKIGQWLTNCKVEILSQLKEEAMGLDEMMLNIFQSHNLIVDLGWQGSMQDMLELYAVIKGMKITFEGLYLGTLNNSKKNGFLFSKYNEKSANNIMCFSGLLEVLFMPEHGSVKGIVKVGDEFQPKYAKLEFSKDSMRIIRQVQDGITNYLESMRSFNYLACPEIKDRIKKLERWGCRPTKSEIERYSKIEFWDNGQKKVLVDEIGLLSFVNFRKVVSKFIVSRWKTAYLKQLFRLNFPYEKVVILLRQMR